jgi:hypothetical protein
MASNQVVGGSNPSGRANLKVRASKGAVNTPNHFALWSLQSHTNFQCRGVAMAKEAKRDWDKCPRPL